MNCNPWLTNRQVMKTSRACFTYLKERIQESKQLSHCLEPRFIEEAKQWHHQKLLVFIVGHVQNFQKLDAVIPRVGLEWLRAEQFADLRLVGMYFTRDTFQEYKFSVPNACCIKNGTSLTGLSEQLWRIVQFYSHEKATYPRKSRGTHQPHVPHAHAPHTWRASHAGSEVVACTLCPPANPDDPATILHAIGA